MRHNVGAIPVSPEMVKQGIENAVQTGKTVFELVKKVFSAFGDKSPNYPIKSANTEKALRREVSENIPIPVSVAHAKELIAKAEQLKELNLKRNNSDKVIKTIRMMYDEAIAALNMFISSGALPATGSMVFGDGSGTYTNTGNGKAIFLPGVTANTQPGSSAPLSSTLPGSTSSTIPGSASKGSGMSFLLIAAVAAGGLYFLSKKSR